MAAFGKSTNVLESYEIHVAIDGATGPVQFVAPSRACEMPCMHLSVHLQLNYNDDDTLGPL